MKHHFVLNFFTVYVKLFQLSLQCFSIKTTQVSASFNSMEVSNRLKFETYASYLIITVWRVFTYDANVINLQIPFCLE